MPEQRHAKRALLEGEGGKKKRRRPKKKCPFFYYSPMS
jgi:hypothetical protein